MTPDLYFDNNPSGKKYSFFVMTQSEKELDEVVKNHNTSI